MSAALFYVLHPEGTIFQLISLANWLYRKKAIIPFFEAHLSDYHRSELSPYCHVLVSGAVSQVSPHFVTNSAVQFFADLLILCVLAQCILILAFRQVSPMIIMIKGGKMIFTNTTIMQNDVLYV